MKERKFQFHLAKRNIQANKKSSLVIILTLSLIFCLLILLFGMKPTFSRVYELQAKNQYNQIDIVMTYDEYSSSRLINKRDVTEDYKDYVHYAMSFFNLDVLVETNDYIYLNMISSLPHEFEYMVDDDVLILKNQVIITETLSKEYDLSIGDQFKFYILDKTFEYVVGDIFEDEGLFSGNSFYMDKEELMSNVYGFTLSNFGNTLYIDINDQYDVDQVIDIFSEDENFDDYLIFPAIDWLYIESRAMDLISMMLAVGLIIILGVFLVLDSLFPIISKDIVNQQGVVSTLGGDKLFVWKVYLIQWIIYTGIAFIIGYILSFSVTNYALYMYGIKGFIPIRLLPLLFSLLVVLFYVILRAYISYQREYISSPISLSKDKRYKKYRTKEIYIITAFVLLIMIYVFKFFSVEINSLLIVLLSIFLTFNVLSLVVVKLSKVFSKKKSKSLFTLFQLKYLQNNKYLHQSLRVLIICLISLIMIFSVRSFLYSEIDVFYNTMTYDLAIANVYDYDDSLLDDLNTYDIESADKASFYQNSYLHFGDRVETCKYLISMDYNQLSNYFDFNVLEFDDSYLSNEEVFTILPKSYKMVYDLEVGDTVSIDVNYSLQNVEMKIAGFIDLNIDNFVYTNIVYVEGYQETTKINAVFINSEDKDNLYNQLIIEYSSSMYYVLNPNVYFDDIIAGVENVTDFFSVFTLFMIICFVIIVFNNTLLIFYNLKTDLAKIKVLGADKIEFIKSLFKEFLFLIIIILFIGIIEMNILSEHLKYVVLLTNYYKDINSTPLTIFYGCVIVSFVLFISYVYYFNNINKIDIVNQMKIY